jgi:streptomycin 6-kinase
VGGDESNTHWLRNLQKRIQELKERWSLKIGSPFLANASCSWVAPCVRENNVPAVLKLGIPHSSAESEIDGLLFWNGDPTIFLLEADREINAMLLERCHPGTSLQILPEEEQDRSMAIPPMMQRSIC